ncbi:MAG: ribonuclease P protein component [Polaromonas sp.]
MQRLKTRPQFQAVLSGLLVAKTSHFALHRIEIQTNNTADVLALFPVAAAWIGAMVPKRWAKRAVTRNAIKRQIYTVSASLTSPIPQAAFLVRLRREFSRKDFPSATSTALKEAVRSELLVLMQSAV